MVDVKMLHDNSLLTISMLHDHPAIGSTAEAYRLLSNMAPSNSGPKDTARKGILHKADSGNHCNKHVAFRCLCTEPDYSTDSTRVQRPTVDYRFLNPGTADLNERRPAIPKELARNKGTFANKSTFTKLLLAISGIALGALLTRLVTWQT